MGSDHAVGPAVAAGYGGSPAATANSSAPSCSRSTPRAARRDIAHSLAMGGRRLPRRAHGGRARRPRAHQVGAAPLDGLERAVAEMTEGVAGPPADVAGPPELRHFTSAFNTMAQVVRASLERQRRLVADASHQLRNPLAAVRLRADSLDDSVAESGRPTYRSMTARARPIGEPARPADAAGARRTGQRKPPGRVVRPPPAESTDLGDVIAERMAFWQPVAEDKDAQLLDRSRTIPASRCRSPAMTWSSYSMSRWTMLCGMRVAQRRSRCPPGQTDETAELVVSDDGSGLPDEDLSRASARFWRGKDDGAGTGLGLAIAAEIAAGHGGTVGVEKAPEGGLLVRFRLPVAGD